MIEISIGTISIELTHYKQSFPPHVARKALIFLLQLTLSDFSTALQLNARSSPRRDRSHSRWVRSARPIRPMPGWLPTQSTRHAQLFGQTNAALIADRSCLSRLIVDHRKTTTNRVRTAPRSRWCSRSAPHRTGARAPRLPRRGADFSHRHASQSSAGVVGHA